MVVVTEIAWHVTQTIPVVIYGLFQHRQPRMLVVIYDMACAYEQKTYSKLSPLFEISSSHSGEYQLQICVVGCTAV
jgi:hypothetical protein